MSNVIKLSSERLLGEYQDGDTKVKFSKNGERLIATIDTLRMRMLPVESTEKDYDDYSALFGDKEVVEKFADGEPKSREKIRERIDDSWAKRWENENDPYSGFKAIKKDTGEFMGHVILGHGDEPGQAEIAYLFKKTFWGQGYGMEAAKALVEVYAPGVFKEGYLLEGEPLNEIRATTRVDNLPSVKILEKLGMEKLYTSEKFGNERYTFGITMENILERKERAKDQLLMSA